MSEWKDYKFSDLIEKVIDNRGKTCPTSETGFPLIATNCIRNEKLYPDFINVRYVSEDTYSNWFRGHPEPNDLIFVLKGTPGRVCFTPDPVTFCIAQDMVAIRVKKEIISPKFLFAILRSPLVQQRIEALHVGSLIPHFKKGDFDRLLIPVCEDKKIQKLIGETYYDFCDKIELNNQINQNLEALAQALFKQWFVDFEFPNENGEPYKSSGGDMIDSELGEIPEGWEVKSLDEIAEYLNGIALQKFRPINETDPFLPVIKIRELRQGYADGEEKASIEIDKKYIILDGDILFSWSGSLLVDFWTGGKGALNQHLFKVTSQTYPKWFIFLWTKFHLLEFQKIAESKATTMGHIQRKHLSDAKVLVPSNSLLKKFTETFDCIIEELISSRLESRKLMNLRDTLLPKLISGELEVNESLLEPTF
jgi:type I restriction enzyme S subunit